MKDMVFVLRSPCIPNRENLKSLTRYRFTKVQERSKLKSSISRLVTILFPELTQIVSCIPIASIYAILEEFPGASYLATAHHTRLTNGFMISSRGCFGNEYAIKIRNLAKESIGSVLPATSLVYSNGRSNAMNEKSKPPLPAQTKQPQPTPPPYIPPASCPGTRPSP